jgi:hypothetical protein
VANATLYADRDGKLPVTVTLTASLAAGDGVQEIARRTLSLEHTGEERTGFRFVLRDQRLVADSVNHLDTSLWRHP